jgi:hypothetical protein
MHRKEPISCGMRCVCPAAAAPPRPAQPHATTEDPSNRWRGRNRRRFSLARSGRVVGSSFGATAKTPVRSRSWASCLPRRLDLWTC